MLYELKGVCTPLIRMIQMERILDNSKMLNKNLLGVLTINYATKIQNISKHT